MNKNKQKILDAFSSKYKTYDQYSIVQKEVSMRMMERLKSIKSSPKNILDIGCGTGFLSKLLAKNFPDSNIICLDFSHEMIKSCRSKNAKFNLVVADAEYLPFKANSFDLVISSFTLHWCTEIEKIFLDIYNILNNDGFFMFSTVGPDTLIELRNAYKLIDDNKHVNDFHDMHIYGDLLLSSNYNDPVTDVERIIIEYDDFSEVLKSLRKTGASTVQSSNSYATSMKTLKDLEKFYQINKQNNCFPVTYEMIYGLAWKNLTQNHEKRSGVIPIKKI